MKKINKPVVSSLREKAVELLKMESKTISSLPSEAELLRLLHELEVHQIELKIQNQELKQSKEQESINAEKYSKLFDLAPSGYCILSKIGEIIEINNIGKKMLEKDSLSLKNSMFGFFISNDTKPVFHQFISKIFKTKIKESCTVSLSISDKIPTYVYLTGYVWEDNENCIVNMVDISHLNQSEENLKNKIYELTIARQEITLQNEEKGKRTEELMIINKQLEQSMQLNSDKDLFISTIAHDLKNSFSIILGYSELLLNDIQQLDIKQVNNLLTEINTSTQNTSILLEDLLNWSRASSGKIAFEPHILSLKDIYKDIIKIFKPIADVKNISISYSAKDDIKLFADWYMLKSILRNLVSNAIKFTNKNGKIYINAEENSGNVIISVSDNGIGILPEQLTKLFNISQIHSTEGTANEKGTGFGLFICKGFTEKHGGKIWVESEEGKGSVFYFNIPSKSKQEEQGVVLVSDETKKIDSLKILIVDDNESISLILNELLRNYSKEILISKTGQEAITVLKNNPDIDLILMDLYMPGMDGHETTMRIREINKKVVIFVETAFSLAEVTEEFAGVAFDDYFPKPFSASYLDELMIKHFSTKKLK